MTIAPQICDVVDCENPVRWTGILKISRTLYVCDAHKRLMSGLIIKPIYLKSSDQLYRNYHATLKAAAVEPGMIVGVWVELPIVGPRRC